MGEAAMAGVQMKAGAQAGNPAVSRQQMPLSFLKGGESALVAKVRGTGDIHHHLENLGFVEGAKVTVVTEAAGDLIVEIKGTQVALNRQLAQRIITKG